MTKKINRKSPSGKKSKGKEAAEYTLPENLLDFYVSENRPAYGEAKPYSVYHDDPEHSLRLLNL